MNGVLSRSKGRGELEPTAADTYELLRNRVHAALATNSSGCVTKQFAVFQVSLYDWWLIKADASSDGRVLGVGGLSSKEQLGIRILHSAAIVRRHNTNTVETADGLTITFSGSINKPRTVLNGFPPEVCNQFIFGFPYYWEEFSSKSFAKEASNRAVDNSADGANNFLPKSFDNLPGALIRDFFVSTIESSGSGKLRNIFEDMMQTYVGDSLNQRAELVSPSKEINQVTRDCAQDETCTGHKKMKVKQKQKDEDDISSAKPRKEFQKVAREFGIGPSTRSMSRLKVASNKQEGENLLRSSEKSQLIKSVSLSEAPMKQHGGSVTGGNVSSVSSTTRIVSLRNRATDFDAKGRRLTLRNRSIDFHIKDGS